jgi:hypothetical protein
MFLSSLQKLEIKHDASVQRGATMCPDDLARLGQGIQIAPDCHITDAEGGGQFGDLGFALRREQVHNA